MTSHFLRVLRVSIPAFTLAGALFGCAGRAAAPVTPPAAATFPRTAGEVAGLLAGAMNHLDLPRYSEFFTGDYQFVFATSDSAGNAYAERAMTRDDELEVSRNMFVTGAINEPAATRMAVVIFGTPVAAPDSRPGKNPGWHREIKANVAIDMRTPDASFRVSGAMRLFVVRGDSAAIPPDLRARGIGPDPSRWWIERWEDETLSSPESPNDALPSRTITWGAIKSLYR